MLYFHQMNIDPARPDWPERDRFVLSKGHACLALYSALAQHGFFPQEELLTFDRIDSRLQGHPDMRKTPGVEMSTGCLGQGFSAAVGMALAGRCDAAAYRVYVLLGDGELQSGQVWEAVMAASKYKLDNLTAIIDRNGLQMDGNTEEVLGVEPIAARWSAFGWDTREVDGHDVIALAGALAEAARVKGKPSVLIAHTVKGKGISFMEGDRRWHSAAITSEQGQQAMDELRAEATQ